MGRAWVQTILWHMYIEFLPIRPNAGWGLRTHGKGRGGGSGWGRGGLGAPGSQDPARAHAVMWLCEWDGKGESWKRDVY